MFDFLSCPGRVWEISGVGSILAPPLAPGSGENGILDNGPAPVGCGGRAVHSVAAKQRRPVEQVRCCSEAHHQARTAGSGPRADAGPQQKGPASPQGPGPSEGGQQCEQQWNHRQADKCRQRAEAKGQHQMDAQFCRAALSFPCPAAPDLIGLSMQHGG